MFDNGTDREVDWLYVYGKPFEYTARGLVSRLRPNTTYRIQILHQAVPEIKVVIEATTTSAPPTRSQRSPGDGRFEPWFDLTTLWWPVRIAEHHILTDDPFDWRLYNEPRYHAGLDIGGIDTGATAVGDTVYASADGVIRVFNDGPTHTWGWVYYCPDSSQDFVQQFHTSPASDWECNHVVGRSSGRTALVFHRSGAEGGYVTKYAHLTKGSINPQLLAELASDECGVLSSSDCSADPSKSTPIGRGQLIGTIGSSGERDALNLTQQANFGHKVCDASPGTPCERAFIDPHLHYELRVFRGSVADDWYETADGCANGVEEKEYCEWSASRRLVTVLDPEAYLRPLPASWLPRGANTTTEDVAAQNGDQRVIEITSALELASGALSIGLSFSAWRPAFYSRYWIANDRFRWQGLRGTRPGVSVYYTRISCSAPQNAVVAGSFADESLRTGEFPAQARTAVLRPPSARATSCDLTINTGNPAYPYIVPEFSQLIPYTPVSREDIELEDPAFSLTWVALLDSGTDRLSESKTLDNDNRHLFTFRAVPGQTYRFCTTSGTAGTACEDESASASVAELLLVGPAAEGESGVVADGPGLVRGANGLAWTVPDPANAAVETYAVVVRRRARYEGGDVAAHSYRLKYTIPELPRCDNDAQEPFFCTPQTPVVLRTSSVMHDSATVHFAPGPGATNYRIERIGGGTRVVEEILGGKDARTHTLSRLSADTEYTIRVQGYNSAAESAWSGSRMVRTLGLPFCSALGGEARDGSSTRSAASCRLGPPVGLSVGDVTAASARVSWSSGDPQTSGYRLSLDGRPLDPQPDLRGATSHTFAGLSTATTAHVFGVIATGTGVADSEPANLTLLLPPSLATPTATQNTLRTTWTADPRATNYQVKLGSAGTTGPAESDSGHTFRGLASDTAFELYVRARNAQGESAWRSVRGRTNPQVGCPPVEQRPARPTASESETVSISTDWVVGDTKADQVRTTNSRTRTRTVSWLAAPECRWQIGAWGAWVSATTTTTLRTLPRPADRTRVNEDENGDPYWTVSGGTACEWQDWMLQPQRNQPVFSEDEEIWEFHESGWEDVGEPTTETRRTQTPCIRRPADRTRVDEDESGASYWIVSGSSACEWQDWTLQSQRNQAVFSVADEQWRFHESGWEDDGVPTTDARRTQIPCEIQLDPHVEVVTIETTTQTRWDRREVVVCLEYEQRRTGHRQSHYLRPYIWNAGATAWQIGPRNPATPIFTHPPGVYSFGAWENTGTTRLCPLQRRSEGATTADLPAGDYIMQWGEVRFAFTVPAGGLSLTGRLTGSGDELAVFSVKVSTELVVDPASLSADTTANAALFTEVTDSSLIALAATLRRVEDSAPNPSETVSAESGECSEASMPAEGATAIALGERSCAIMFGGGTVTVTAGELALSLSLPATQDWLLLRHTTADGVLALTLVELASAASLTLSFADAGELGRQVGSEAAAIGLLFDQIRAAAQAAARGSTNTQ